MSVFHTPRCRITWTEVKQGNRNDVARPNESFAFRFGLWLDTAIWFTGGWFRIQHAVLQNGQLIDAWTRTGYTPTDLAGRPSANVWIGQFWWTANQATHGRDGVFLYKPSVWFDMRGPGASYIPGEFAVAEEDHYFIIDW